MSPPHFLEPLLHGSRSAVSVVRTEPPGAPIATTIETAFDSAARRRGLLGRPAFAQGSAMIIAPCSAVHTFFMRFPIDVVFVRHDGRVLKVAHAVPAWRIAVGWGAFAAIELPAGTARRCGLRRDDRLLIAGASPS